MNRQRNTELDFLYTEGKDTKKKKNATKKKNANTTKHRKKSTRAGDMSAQKGNTFNFDNEIVIGVTKIPDEKNTVNSKKKRKSSNKKEKANNKNQNKEKIAKNNTYKKSKCEEIEKKEKLKSNNKKSKIIKSIIKWAILLSALIASFIYFMMSPLFNLTEVQIAGNEKLSTDTIISLSNLTIGENIYKTSINKIKKNIKQNAYIESVEAKRLLPNKIRVTVKERKATYNLEYANSFVYINNQGYILEIEEDKLEVPIIEGYTTSVENIIVGNRLSDEDLEKLGNVLRIMESANVNEIGNLITRINISDKQNYTIILEGEKKTVYLGDASNLSTRMLYIKAILEEEKGIEGEIFVSGDLNKSNVFFRRKE